MALGAGPQQVGRYEIVLPIATGGMATVYLARATGMGGFDRYLALKLTAPHLRNDPEFAAHLIDEAKLVAHLRHPNVVQSFDVGECEHGIYLVMDYVPGDSLAGLRRAARGAGVTIPKSVGLRILVDALKGLHAAHEHTNEDDEAYALVHRDFSPQNILVGTDGIARLTDFGIAKAMSRSTRTLETTIKGKLTYLAPEQARGEPLDRRCDVWAAGVIAWEILSGGRLYKKDDLTPAKPNRPVPPRLRTVAADVPEELDEIVARALRLDRDERTPNAQVLGRALAAAATASKLLADEGEVAELVSTLVGEELAARKERLAEIRRSHGERPQSIPNVRTMVAPPSTPRRKRAPLPSPADIPVTDGEDGSELRISVAAPVDGDRADAEILGDAEIDRISEDDPSVFRSPVAGPERGWNPRKISIAAVIAGALLGFVVVLAVALGGKSNAAVHQAEASAPTEVQAETALLQVRANAPIASVKIGDRLVDAIVPAPSLNVELEEEERGKKLQLVVNATDGRSATASFDGSHEVQVSFAR
jgi:serine/threonine-protein kinase